MRPSEINLVYDDYKLIVFPIRKAASTTIRKAFTNTFGSDAARYLSTAECYDLDYFGISIWRDPVERIESFHSGFIAGKGSIHDQFAAVGMMPDQSIDETARIICEQPDETADPHFASQWSLCSCRDKFLADRLYTIDEWHAFSWVVEAITRKRLPTNPGVHNTSKREQWLSAESVRMIKRRFRYDYLAMPRLKHPSRLV